MGRQYPKGSSRPSPSHTRDRGKPDTGYTLSGGVPWPTLGDGTPYVLPGNGQPVRVRHAELGEEAGTLQWVEWCHPDGSFMPDLDRHTKAKTPRLRPGAWFGVVSWDRRDEPGALLVRHALENLRAMEGEL